MTTATPSGWAAGTATGAAPPGVVARSTMRVAATAAAADLRVTTAHLRTGWTPTGRHPAPGAPATRTLAPWSARHQGPWSPRPGTTDHPLPGRAVCGTGSRAETR